MTTKKTAAKKEAGAHSGPRVKKSPAQCIFDLYNLRFGMTKKEVATVLDFAESGHINETALLKAGATMIQLFFDHLDRLWQVRADYIIDGITEAEDLLDRMSKDYRFHTATSRVAFELDEEGAAASSLAVRYTEINLKRIYLHHMMDLGAQKSAEEERARKALSDAEEEEGYIPTGPMMF